MLDYACFVTVAGWQHGIEQGALMKRKKLIAVGTTLVALSLVLTGCGDDEDGSPETGDPGTSTDQGSAVATFENAMVDGDKWTNVGNTTEILEVWHDALGVDCGDLAPAACKQTYEANFLANISKGDEATKQKIFAALTVTREYLGDSDVSGYSGDYTDVIGSTLGVDDYLTYLSGPVLYNNDVQGETYFVNEMVDDKVKYLFYGDESESDLEPKLDGGVYPAYQFTYVTEEGKTRPVTMFTNDGVPCDFNLCVSKDQTKTE